ncbi:ATP-grasp domain-containing protein [Rhodococcus chondri]|uniref:ATP-grasp domain-containing protein n=1 Tax=Rhodococcus chondri TaxID=3065941 RepID=A0ABU7JP47_9NOCA|nr:ATP-grasp domain-containing protein [Rhodococcus sp. CC-R104]MEE2031813.1 ATP-grasp domain-containing protein [Rhodococcus sp. CC-R104]
MAKNIFILGLTDQQRDELGTVSDADELRFHSLLDYHSLVEPETFVFRDLLDRARQQLDDFDGSVDGIVAHWDFPTSVLTPILAAERGLPAPSLRSILQCEHKAWSRLEQRECVSECVPGFAVFDPFDDNALDSIDLKFPFWVKPVKAHSSQLGFEIRNAEQFAAALEEIRAGIGRVGDAFDEVLSMVELPDELQDVGGNMCLAEDIITGIQVAPEGTMFNGEYRIHGIFDMRKDDAGHSFDRLDYPARSVPADVQQRMIDVTERYLRHIGFDNGCFNSEFMWDEKTDTLSLIEVNTRISQSHSDLFVKVDGTSNHEVAIDIALGRKPRIEHGKGRYEVAAQCHMGYYDDGIVRSVPGDEDIVRVRDEIPDTVVDIKVKVGDRLSELPNQDGYRAILATLYIGASDIGGLEKFFDRASELLPFDIEPVAK